MKPGSSVNGKGDRGFIDVLKEGVDVIQKFISGLQCKGVYEMFWTNYKTGWKGQREDNIKRSSVNNKK